MQTQIQKSAWRDKEIERRRHRRFEQTLQSFRRSEIITAYAKSESYSKTRKVPLLRSQRSRGFVL